MKTRFHIALRPVALRFLGVLLFGVLAQALPGTTSADTQQPMSQVALEVGGARLRLGMTKAQVAEKLVGQEITKIHEDEWMLGSLKEGHIHLGPTLQFTKGVLSYAEREWTTGQNDVGEALFGAVSSLEQDGLSQCQVTADTKPGPDLSATRVWIICGAKSVSVVNFHLSGHNRTSVYERLGTYQDFGD